MRISDWSSDVCSSDLANDEFLIIGGCAQRRACSRLGDGHAFVGGAKNGPCRRQAGVRAIGMDQCLSQGLALADAGYGQTDMGGKPFWKPVVHRLTSYRKGRGLSTITTTSNRERTT